MLMLCLRLLLWLCCSWSFLSPFLLLPQYCWLCCRLVWWCSASVPLGPIPGMELGLLWLLYMAVLQPQPPDIRYSTSSSWHCAFDKYFCCYSGVLGDHMLNWCSLNFAHLVVGNKVTGQANYICLQISIVTSLHTSIGIKNWRPKLFVLF